MGQLGIRSAVPSEQPYSSSPLAFAGRAQFLTVTPDQAAAWWPEMALDEDQLTRVRDLLWTAQSRTRRLITISTAVWIFGLMITAAGAAAGLLSYGTSHSQCVCSRLHWEPAWSSSRSCTSSILKAANREQAKKLSDRATTLMLEPSQMILNSKPKNPGSSFTTDVHVEFADSSSVILQNVSGQRWTIDDQRIKPSGDQVDASVEVVVDGTSVKFVQNSH